MIIKYANNDRELIEIVPGVYLGSIASIIFTKTLKETGITHVISIVNDLKLSYVLISFNSRIG